VKVPSGGNLHAGSGNAEGGVMKSVVFYVGVGSIGEPDGSSVEDYGSDDGFVCGDYRFFCWPQLVPAKAIKMLRRGVMRETRLFMGGPKLK